MIDLGVVSYRYLLYFFMSIVSLINVDIGNVTKWWVVSANFTTYVDYMLVLKLVDVEKFMECTFYSRCIDAIMELVNLAPLIT